MDWFLYDNGLRHERVKGALSRSQVIFRQRVSQNWASVQNFFFKWRFLFELCQANVFMVFVQPLLSAENEWAFVYNNFLAATVVDKLFDNLVLFKNVEKKFLLNIGIFKESSND